MSAEDLRQLLRWGHRARRCLRWIPAIGVLVL